ncbi:glycosyl transferase family 1 [Streptomyces tateyamensis]|uniref:Glycosyl transferase family 1 n=1 Tax=Streptomyces tateyamensis TaxID=565073 RepID=A0A2V4MSN9_9ACTN|nr:glycosyltransferase [Streptomyces tateyamensis]PYC65766.1 glycosyl transferase family 1 [Streptomyces tateyamensis]
MTILHISQPVDGGVARVVTDLVRGQRAAGHRVLVACPSGGRLAPAAKAAGAEHLDWPARRSPGPSVPAETARLRRLVRQAAPDLVHLHSAKAGLAGRLAVRGRVPTVFQPHAWSFAAATGALATASTRWERYAARWAAAVLCVSERERADGLAAGIEAAYTVVPNGVDLAYYAPAERRAARLSLGLDLSGPLAVCVGRLCRQKGQDLLLAAWPDVLCAVPGAQLALVGGGPDQQALQARARALPEPYRVRLVGDVADPRPWLAAADLVVLPSRWEGMALAPLEAMAMARPVLLADVPGAREQLPAAERESALVPVEDPAALAGALAAALADPLDCARRGAAARAWVTERHDTRTMVERVDDLYQKSTSAGQPTPRVSARI